MMQATTDVFPMIYLCGHGLCQVYDLRVGKTKIDPAKLSPSLAKINRFAGNTSRPWSVAAHSVLVSQTVPSIFAQLSVFDTDRMLEQRLRHMDPKHNSNIRCVTSLWGLLHDVVETIVGDTPAPVKHAENFSPWIETDIEAQIFMQHVWPHIHGMGFFGLVPDNAALVVKRVVKLADMCLLLAEQKQFQPEEAYLHMLRTWCVTGRQQEFIERIDVRGFLREEMTERSYPHHMNSLVAWDREADVILETVSRRSGVPATFKIAHPLQQS